jgi:hypothetical protein
MTRFGGGGGLGLAEILALGLTLLDGLTELDGLTDAEKDALGLCDGLGISTARNVMTPMTRCGFAGGLGLALRDADGLTELDGLLLRLDDADGLLESELEADGLTELSPVAVNENCGALSHP